MASALDIMRKYMRTYPVDVYAIARELGISVRKKTMPPQHSASIRRDKHGKYHIDLNINDPETRQRFSLAHELGHFLYHKKLIGDGVSDSPAFRSPDPSVYDDTLLEPHHETQANQFAANLLMPKALVAQAKEDVGGRDIPKMARALNVSVPAMRVRLGLSPYAEPQEEFGFVKVD